MKFYRDNSIDCNSPSEWRPNIGIRSDWSRNEGYEWWAMEERGHGDTLGEAQEACEMAVWRQYSGPRKENKEK